MFYNLDWEENMETKESFEIKILELEKEYEKIIKELYKVDKEKNLLLQKSSNILREMLIVQHKARNNGYYVDSQIREDLTAEEYAKTQKVLKFFKKIFEIRRNNKNFGESHLSGFFYDLSEYLNSKDNLLELLEEKNINQSKKILHSQENNKFYKEFYYKEISIEPIDVYYNYYEIEIQGQKNILLFLRTKETWGYYPDRDKYEIHFILINKNNKAAMDMFINLINMIEIDNEKNIGDIVTVLHYMLDNYNIERNIVFLNIHEKVVLGFTKRYFE